MLQDAIAPLRLTFHLWLRFWPQLCVLVLLGVLAHDLLLQAAVHASFIDHQLGFAVLALVALAELIVTVMMFHTVRPALPALAGAEAAARAAAATPSRDRKVARLATVITVALLPFFAYYATWGFLGNTVRQYSRLALELDPFGEYGMVLDGLDSRWLLISIALSWAIRKLAQIMKRRTQHAIWQFLIVLCETNWIFIGLYVFSQWEEDILALIGSRNAWGYLQSFWDALATPIRAAWSATEPPVEATAVDGRTTVISLFWYTLLPIIWLVMAALIYGYDVRDDAALLRHGKVGRLGGRYRMMPAFLRDFVEHFIGGYRSRYLPVANSMRLTLNSSLVLLITLVVGYRMLTWGAAWLWLGGTRVIGPHELDSWQVMSRFLTLLFGSPVQDSSRGILIEPLRICLLAAVLEAAFAMPKRAPSPAVAPPQPAPQQD